MARADLIVAGKRVVIPDGIAPAAIVIRDGTITAVADYGAAPDAARRVDVGDAAVLPGVVDTHVHVNEPGRTEWEGFETATRAAAAGGVTTIVDMPLNSIPPTVSVPALKTKARAAGGRCHIDVGFWGGAVPGNQGELEELHEAGVFGFKCFLLDSGVEEFPRLAGLELEAAMPEPIAAAPAPKGRRYLDYLRSRPPEAETEAIALLVELCRRTGARVHVVHLSAAGALPTFRQARADGLPMTVETCPHYLCLTPRRC